MSKLFKILGLIFFLILIIVFTLPYLFKDQITDIVKSTANDHLAAEVNFKDIDLSFISSFPNLAVSINEISIINREPFEGDTVFSSKSFNASVDILSLFSGNSLDITSIVLNEPKIIAYILEDGNVNFNITKEVDSDSSKNVADGSNKRFNIKLKSYSIINGQIAYFDQTSNMIIAMNKLNHSGSGNFGNNNFLLDTETNIEELTVQFDGIKYLTKVKTLLDLSVDVNLLESKYVLKDNSLQLNNLQLNLDGYVVIPQNGIELDVEFNSPRTNFKDIISLIPAIYSKDFSEIKTSGEMQFEGNAKGILNKTEIPSFNISLNVENGMLKYPDLPIPIKNVGLVLNLKNVDGIKDNTKINLSKFHIELDKDPFNAKMIITNPISGPNIDAEVKGLIDLSNLKNAFAFDNIEKLEGTIQSNVTVKGNISKLKDDYENINTNGEINASNVFLRTKTSPEEIIISTAKLKFSSKIIALNQFSANIGKSDIRAKGYINNLISYVFSDGTIKGNFNVNSNYFDFNPYLQTDSEEVSESDSVSNKNSAFNIPDKIDFKLVSNFKKLIYDNLELKNVTGEILVKNNKVELNNLKMNLLNGTLAGSGSYQKDNLSENPKVLFSLNISNFNVKESYDKFISVKQFAPIAKHIKGSFSSKLSLNTILDNNMIPKWETFFSNGKLDLKSAEINNFKPFTTLSSVLNLKELSNPKINNLTPKFEIKNGRFYISPVNFKIDKYNIVLSGSNGIDKTIDYSMDINIPANKLKNESNKAISNLFGKKLNLIKANSIKVKAKIGGTLDSPSVKTSAGDLVSNTAGSVVNQAKTQVIEKAKVEVDSLKIKAEKKIKEEAKKKEEELKEKLEEEAKKKLKKIFGFG